MRMQSVGALLLVVSGALVVTITSVGRGGGERSADTSNRFYGAGATVCDVQTLSKGHDATSAPVNRTDSGE